MSTGIRIEIISAIKTRTVSWGAPEPMGIHDAMSQATMPETVPAL